MIQKSAHEYDIVFAEHARVAGRKANLHREPGSNVLIHRQVASADRVHPGSTPLQPKIVRETVSNCGATFIILTSGFISSSSVCESLYRTLRPQNRRIIPQFNLFTYCSTTKYSSKTLQRSKSNQTTQHASQRRRIKRQRPHRGQRCHPRQLWKRTSCLDHYIISYLPPHHNPCLTHTPPNSSTRKSNHPPGRAPTHQDQRRAHARN